MAFSDVGFSEQMPIMRAISDADMPVLSSVNRTSRSRTDKILLLDVPLIANPDSFNSEISSSENVLDMAAPINRIIAYKIVGNLRRSKKTGFRS